MLKIIFFLFFFFFSNILMGYESNSRNIQEKKDEGAIQLVITKQIKAFKSNDFKLAYSFASNYIKKIFPSSKIFEQMIVKSYPMINNPKKYEFINLRYHSGSLLQRVLFLDQNDRIFYFDYQMVKGLDDNWLINGVYSILVEEQEV